MSILSPSFSADLTLIVRTALQQSNATGEDLPFYLREPRARFTLPMGLLVSLLGAAAITTGWGLFVVPLGVPAIGLATAFGFALLIGLVSLRTPNPVNMLADMDAADAINESPFEQARANAVAHLIPIIQVVVFLIMWASIGIVGLFV